MAHRYDERYGNEPYRGERSYSREDRGFIERAGDEVRSWFGDDEAERRRRADEQERERHDRMRSERGWTGGGDRWEGPDRWRGESDRWRSNWGSWRGDYGRGDYDRPGAAYRGWNEPSQGYRAAAGPGYGEQWSGEGRWGYSGDQPQYGSQHGSTDRWREGSWSARPETSDRWRGEGNWGSGDSRMRTGNWGSTGTGSGGYGQQYPGGWGFGERQSGESRGFYETDRGRVYQFSHGSERGYGGHMGRGPKGYQRADNRIREDICDRLTDDPRIDASEIEVAVNNCEVTLSGMVHDREDKRNAEDLVASIPGVRDVHNNLRVGRWNEGRFDTGGGSSSQSMSGQGMTGQNTTATAQGTNTSTNTRR